jgi:hypothetical protein
MKGTTVATTRPNNRERIVRNSIGHAYLRASRISRGRYRPYRSAGFR